jgi:hypothetical protein
MDKKRERKVKPIVKHEASNKSDRITFKFPDLKKLFFHSEDFIKSIENEKDYQPILISYILIYLGYFIIRSVSDFILQQTTLYDFAINFIGIVIFAVFMPFFASLMFHIFVKIFKGEKGFFNTFKPVTYVLIIGIIYSLILFIINSIFQFLMPIDYTSLNNLKNTVDQAVISETVKNFFLEPRVIFLMAINLIILAIQLIHQFKFLSKGFIKFQNLAKTRAVWAVIFGALLIFFIICLIMFILSLGAIVG